MPTVADGMWEMAGGAPRRATGMTGGPQGGAMGGGAVDSGLPMSRPTEQSQLAELEQELELMVTKLEQTMSSTPRNEREAMQLSRAAEGLKMRIEYLREKIEQVRARLLEERERRERMGAQSNRGTSTVDPNQGKKWEPFPMAGGGRGRWVPSGP